MGFAAAPQNPNQTVHLEIMSGTNPAYLVSYDPPAVSGLPAATNFLVKNFAGQGSGWLFAEASTPAMTNLAHVANWSPGLGVLNPGSSGQTLPYGGIALECGLLRVFTVYLEAGQDYRF